MDLVDQVPVGVVHLVEGLVAQDAGVVHHHVDAAEGFDRAAHDVFPVGHRIVVGHRGAAGGADFRHHAVGGGGAGALAMGAAAEIVDHHLRAVAGEQQRMGASEAAAGAGDDHHLVVETQGITHGCTPWQGCLSASVGQRPVPHKEDRQP
ncbi:hypothetical protein D3C76_715710 [compost metagenome]